MIAGYTDGNIRVRDLMGEWHSQADMGAIFIAS
jgi:hypothetical protein